MPIHRIAILMTSYNRRETTLRSLGAIHRQKGIDDVETQIFLVDDGSTDGTGDAIRSRFPAVRVLQGDGTLFWVGALRLAFAAAEQESFDAYVHINDDTMLEDDALQRLIATADACLANDKPAIVVGSTWSPQSGWLNYGGLMRRRHALALSWELVEPKPHEQVVCETMQTNLALIPAEIARVVGNFEARFSHKFADLDYGLRARDAGFSVVVMPGFAGECGDNTPSGTWRDPSISFSKRWKSLNSPKGLPFREWLLFTRRHYGWRFLYYAISPWIKAAFLPLLKPRTDL